MKGLNNIKKKEKETRRVLNYYNVAVDKKIISCKAFSVQDVMQHFNMTEKEASKNITWYFNLNKKIELDLTNGYKPRKKSKKGVKIRIADIIPIAHKKDNSNIRYDCKYLERTPNIADVALYRCTNPQIVKDEKLNIIQSCFKQCKKAW